MSVITKLVVPREYWGMGALLRNRGQNDEALCCLGHLGRACGVPDGEMEELSLPEELPAVYYEAYPAAFIPTGVDSVSGQAANINDDASISNDERERQLIELFGTTGIELSFTGSFLSDTDDDEDDDDDDDDDDE